jgi:hypothetical protein
MIRLAALACGLLCGFGMLTSGLFRPSLLRDASSLAGTRDPTLGLGLLAALGVAGVLMTPIGRWARPLLGGEIEPITHGSGWRVLAGAALFGFGWGLAGYHPLAALVSVGLLAPGAAIFLAALLGGMILHDLTISRGRRGGHIG